MKERGLIEMVKIGGINLTEHKPALKMGQFLSINVDVKSNPFCQKMQENKSLICAQCYADYMERRYPRLKAAMLENYRILSSRVLDAADIEKIGNYVLKHAKGLRFNSIGELINETHCDNLNLIAMYIKNRTPNFPITLWTKRVGLSIEIDGHYIKKIYSNPFIDDPLTQVPVDFSGVFNVCSAAWFKSKRCAPNCAGHCADCMKCYAPKSTDFVIIEMLKADQNKLKRAVVKDDQ